MKYLLDTHTFLWYFLGSKKISVDVKEIIDNKDFELYKCSVIMGVFH